MFVKENSDRKKKKIDQGKAVPIIIIKMLSRDMFTVKTSRGDA